MKSVAGSGPGSATASGWIERDESAAKTSKLGVIDSVMALTCNNSIRVVSYLWKTYRMFFLW